MQDKHEDARAVHASMDEGAAHVALGPIHAKHDALNGPSSGVVGAAGRHVLDASHHPQLSAAGAARHEKQSVA